jgi:hypothetical protein
MGKPDWRKPIKLEEKHKKAVHFLLILLILADLVVLGHATMADWSFTVLALLVEVNL